MRLHLESNSRFEDVTGGHAYKGLLLSCKQSEWVCPSFEIHINWHLEACASKFAGKFRIAHQEISEMGLAGEGVASRLIRRCNFHSRGTATKNRHHIAGI